MKQKHSIESLILVHYGSKEYNPKKVSKVKNEWIKPIGGLWTSPLNSEWGWKHWCEAEQFRECDSENCFHLKFKEGAKVLIIDCLKDLLNAPKMTNELIPNWKKEYMDFEAISKTHDAIWLTAEGQSRTRWSEPSLYGWDCESVLILNPNCVEQVEIKNKVEPKIEPVKY